jgi:type II secretory pathway component PulJ
MVAVTILGIVTTVVYGGFSQTMRNKRRIEDQSDRAHVDVLRARRNGRCRCRRVVVGYFGAHGQR